MYQDFWDICLLVTGGISSPDLSNQISPASLLVRGSVLGWAEAGCALSGSEGDASLDWHNSQQPKVGRGRGVPAPGEKGVDIGGRRVGGSRRGGSRGSSGTATTGESSGGGGRDESWGKNPLKGQTLAKCFDEYAVAKKETLRRS
jgi:hypothetical protein